VLAVHGHFYQPPRENPWTEEVGVEPSAAPAESWNARITDESYRPNGWAEVLHHGTVVDVVNNYANLSFDVGPTLTSWLADHAGDVLARMVEGDRAGGGAIAQAYNHAILPLADEADVRTQVRWGLADFRHRFGREAAGMWLPEAAVSDAVLAVLAEEGVRFTILAPGQARRVRPLGADGRADPVEPWVDVDGGTVDGRRTYRWLHPSQPGLGVDLVFYDGSLSHDLAFSIGSLPVDAFVARALAAAGDGGLVCAATDGETFGHHHRHTERALAWALPSAAPAAGPGGEDRRRPPRGRPADVAGRGPRVGLVLRARGGSLVRPTAAAPPAAPGTRTAAGERRCGRRSTSCATRGARSTPAGRPPSCGTPPAPSTDTATCSSGRPAATPSSSPRLGPGRRASTRSRP
jgi:alpha-amylase/alpha-mannosidase (GH57 family)